MRVAVVDLGSNSVRSLTVEMEEGRLRFVDGTSTITRLSEGIGREGFLVRPEALERTIGSLGDLKRRLSDQSVAPEARAFFATESLRAASEVQEIRPLLEEAAGLSLQIISGEEEARLSAQGVLLGGLEAEGVFDLGGGSLEIIAEEPRSFPLGAVRLTGLFGEDRTAMARHVLETLRAAALPPVRTLAGVGGTSSALAMMLRSYPREIYHPSLTHGCPISRFQVQLMNRDLAALSLEERRNVVGLEAKRADIIVAGLTVIETLLAHWGLTSYRHSECDLLWGMAQRVADAWGFSPQGVLF